MGLFVLGDFVMHSGATGRYKIDCDAVSRKDLQCLAFMLAERLPRFGPVVPVPRGGVRLADALAAHSSSGQGIPGLPVLVVDDVLTTGRSMEEYRTRQNGLPCLGAVLFARGPCPAWVTPLFTLTPELPGRCPGEWAARRGGNSLMDNEFVYRDGRFESGDPLGVAGLDDWVGTLREKGYYASQAVGDTNGLSYELYDHAEDGWAVIFQTVSRCCLVWCGTWPDLIGLLALLSGIALAGVLEEANDSSGCARLPVSLPREKRRTAHTEGP